MTSTTSTTSTTVGISSSAAAVANNNANNDNDNVVVDAVVQKESNNNNNNDSNNDSNNVYTYNNINKIISIHENERCWIGRGWCKNLLPNDCGKYSYTDGSKSYKTLHDINNDLLEYGIWNDIDNNNLNNTDKITDNGNNGNTNNYCGFHIVNENEDGGWWYSRDFSLEAIRDAKAIRNGALHWVRYRKLSKQIKFNPNIFCLPEIYQYCEQGDSKIINELSNKLLHTLTYIILIHCHSGRSMNHEHIIHEAILIQYKHELIQLLIQHESGQEDAFYQLDILYRQLQSLAEKHYNEYQKQKSSNILLSTIFSSSNNNEEKFIKILPFTQLYELLQQKQFIELCIQINERVFNYDERIAIASLIIKKLDPHYQLHCNNIHNNNNNDDCSCCQYKWIKCINNGCNDIMSKQYINNHIEDECQYKLITCECGDIIQKHQQIKHLNEICPLRDTKCPFERIGCTTIIQAKDIPNHVQDDISSHMLLALHRMMEYESTIRKLHQRVNALENENKTLKQTLINDGNKVSNILKITDEKINTLQKKITKMENSHQKEFKNIRNKQKYLEEEQQQIQTIK